MLEVTHGELFSNSRYNENVNNRIPYNYMLYVIKRITLA